jgi:hypothetical protein
VTDFAAGVLAAALRRFPAVLTAVLPVAVRDFALSLIGIPIGERDGDHCGCHNVCIMVATRTLPDIDSHQAQRQESGQLTRAGTN